MNTGYWAAHGVQRTDRNYTSRRCCRLHKGRANVGRFCNAVSGKTVVVPASSWCGRSGEGVGVAVTYTGEAGKTSFAGF
jgi:hypothetical protein